MREKGVYICQSCGPARAVKSRSKPSLQSKQTPEKLIAVTSFFVFLSPSNYQITMPIKGV
jgi:hypothetical protein